MAEMHMSTKTVCLLTSNLSVRLLLHFCLTDAGLIRDSFPMIVVRQGHISDPRGHVSKQEAGEQLWHVVVAETQI